MKENITPVVRTLLILNVGVFLIQTIFEIDIPTLFGLRYFESKEFAPWQIITYMFIHGDMMHVASNMLGLFTFGRWIETVLGSQRFLTFYMVCGMGAGILNSGVLYIEHEMQKNAIIAYSKDANPDTFVQYLEVYEPEYYKKHTTDANNYLKNRTVATSIKDIKENLENKKNAHIMIGASGAVFGILIAFMLIFPNIEMMMLFFPMPIKAKYLVSLYIIYELFAGFGYAGQSNIAHFAHLGGALVGFLLIRLWRISKQY